MRTRWNEVADKELVDAFNSGMETGAIATKTGRTLKAVRARLGRIGINITKSRCYTIRTCSECGKEERVSKSIANRSKFCGQSCAARFNNRIYKLKPRLHCVHCGTSMGRENKKYCSPTCVAVMYILAARTFKWE